MVCESVALSIDEAVSLVLTTLLLVVGKETTAQVVLADCLAVTSVNICNMAQILRVITCHPNIEVAQAGKRGGWKLPTLIKVRGVGATLAKAFLAPRPGFSRKTYRRDNILTLMGLTAEALGVVHECVTGVVKSAVTPVLTSFL